MLKLLKNVVLTALFVVGATMATSAVTAVACFFLASSGAENAPSELLVYGTPAAVILGALAGVFFSIVSLCIAALTMPPALGLIHALKLPRPLLDCVGGGAAGLLCAAIVMAMMESVVRSKGGSMPGDDLRLVLDVCGMVGGAALGYLRHAVLVRKHEAPPAEFALQA